jgi:hypothetical protein
MRKSLLVLTAIALTTSGAFAEQPRAQKPEKAVPPGKVLPLKGAGSANSCAEYGPGFVKVEGSNTCMKVGGAFSIGVGGGTR